MSARSSNFRFRHAGILPVLVLASIALFASPAGAEDKKADKDNYYDHTVVLTLGIFQPKGRTVIRADAFDGTLGTTLVLEDDLAVKDRDTIPFFSTNWHFGKRHTLKFYYFDMERDGVQTLTGDIRFDETTYLVNTTVKTFFNTEIFAVAYQYDFFRTRNSSLGFTTGLHWTTLSTGIDEPVSRTSDEVSADLPLPLFGLDYRLRFGERWHLSADAAMLSVEFDDIEGEILNFNLIGHYRFTKKWALQFGYTQFDLEVDAIEGDLRGRFDYQYKGPSMGISYGF